MSSFITCILADNSLVLYYVNIIRTDFRKTTGFDERCISGIPSKIDETRRCNDQNGDKKIRMNEKKNSKTSRILWSRVRVTAKALCHEQHMQNIWFAAVVVVIAIVVERYCGTDNAFMRKWRRQRWLLEYGLRYLCIKYGVKTALLRDGISLTETLK